MKKRFFSILLAALMLLSLLPVSALAAEEPDYTSVEVTEDSFERVFDLAYRLYDENQQLGTGGGFTWDSEGKKRSWTYYNGIMMDAFLMLDSESFESYVNTFYSMNVTQQGQVNSSGSYDNYYRENELDSIPPTRALFDLLRSDFVSDTEKGNYKRMIDYVYSVMQRYATIDGTCGNFRYKMNNANWETYQLALDGMYMAQPFFMELANALDDGTLTLEDFTSYTGSDEILEDTDEIYSAVFDRMYWVGNSLYDDGNGLYNHAWGPDAGPNGQYWLRAVGWYAAALADVISMLPDNFAEERAMLIEIETRLFDGMIAHQDRDTGLWYNVINYGPELAGPESMNELESSGTALMAYAMMRSYAEGYVERRYGAAGLRAFNAIAALKLDEEGLHDVYQSSVVETYPEGYLSKPYVTNDAKGVGPLFMAAAWAKQAADLYNQPVAVPLCAVDGDTNEALPGVTAQVLDGDGALVAEWNSGTEALPVEGILPGVEYTIHVTEAPTGYELPEDVAFSLDEETLQIILNGDPIDDGVIDIRLFKNKLSIVTEIIPEEGGTVTAEPADPAVDELVTLTAEPAQGYVLKSLTVTDEAGNEIFLDEGQFSMPDGRVTVTAVFEKISIRIDAVDADGNRLEGAVMQLLNADGDIVDEWTSGSELYCVEGLTAGEEYALRVAIPADGYCVGPEAPFTIEFDGSVTYGGRTTTDGEGNLILLMELAATRVCFSVRDTDTGEAIPGVTVHITDCAGITITDWISDDTGYHAVEKLIVGMEYTVRVAGAPEGWLAPEDASFVIGPEGNVTYSGNTGTNNIFETLLLVELKKEAVYPLSGGNVVFFDENFRIITEAAEGKTVTVSPDFESIPAGYWFTGAYEAAPAVEITVDEAGDGTFTMPAEAVTVSLVLAGQEDYDLLLADGEPVELPADMAANLSCTSAFFYDETLDAGVLDLNGDGEPDVLLDFDADTAQRLAGADAITHSVTLSIDAPVPYRYRAVCFRFDENQSAGPVITQQPADVSVPLGELARTRVVAEGEGLNYQWYGREANGREFKSGLRGDTYSVALVKSKIGRTVWCVITDADGNTVTTREAVLNVAYPDDYVYPTITADAADCFVDAGGTASVTIGAEGYGELSYQWYILNKGSQTWAKSGIKGVGADTYSCAMNGTRDGRQIYCVVTDAWGNTATSSTVTIGFDCPEGYEGPGVTVNADDIHTDVDAGEYASVTVTAAGPNGDAEGLSYQWYLRADENAPWSRSSLKGDTYSVKMVPSKSGRQVKCVVTDAYGKKAESAVFTLTMVIPAEYADGPEITGQPGNVTVARGEIAATTVAADGEGLTYQWYGRDPGQQSFWRSSLKTDTYSVKMVPSKSGREVYCVVTDKYGRTVTSDVATLTMAP